MGTLFLSLQGRIIMCMCLMRERSTLLEIILMDNWDVGRKSRSRRLQWCLWEELTTIRLRLSRFPVAVIILLLWQMQERFTPGVSTLRVNLVMEMLKIDIKQRLFNLFYQRMQDQARSLEDQSREKLWQKIRKVSESLVAMKILLMTSLLKIKTYLSFWMLQKRLKKFDAERSILWLELITEEYFHVGMVVHLLLVMDLKSLCIISRKFILYQALDRL